MRFEELDFEIPPSTQKGILNTVEGFISKAIEDLNDGQPARKQVDIEVWKKIEDILAKLRKYQEVEEDFTVTLNDPSGNSHLESLAEALDDPNMKTYRYRRTDEQNSLVGLDPEKEHQLEEEEKRVGKISASSTMSILYLSLTNLAEALKSEVFSIPSNCSNCSAPVECKMKLVDIPYFKEVILMSAVCEACGYKTVEVKAGGEIAEKGKRIILKIEDKEDLSRDILKSESCSVQIPEIELQLDSGTLGGKFSTVEGLLQNVHDELKEKSSFSRGDSVPGEKMKRFEEFLRKLQSCINLEMKYTLIMDDPLGNSYLQNLYAPDPDPNLEIMEYERSWEQNEFFGLNDLKTDNEDDEQNEA